MGCPNCNKKSNILQQAKNIIEGNFNAIFPNEKTKAIAEPRIKICLECNHCKELLRIGGKIVSQCTLCKCPVQSKATVEDEKCPINKW